MLVGVLFVPCFYPLWRPGTKEYLLIKQELRKVLTKGKAAGVLRLVFHDAGTFEIDDNTGIHLAQGIHF